MRKLTILVCVVVAMAVVAAMASSAFAGVLSGTPAAPVVCPALQGSPAATTPAYGALC